MPSAAASVVEVRSPVYAEALERRLLLATDVAMQSAALSGTRFVENRGQWDDEIVLAAHDSGGKTILFTDTGPVFRLTQYAEAETPADDDDAFARSFDPREDRPQLELEAWDELSLTFPGSRAVEPRGINRLETVHNYYLGNDESRWAENVPTYSGVVYENLYDGVDLYFHRDPATEVFHGRFEIHNDAGHDKIRIRRGTEEVPIEVIDPRQITFVPLSPSTLGLEGSAAYVDLDKDQSRLQPMQAGGTSAPELAFGSYFGGGGGDFPSGGVAADGSGGVWLAGYTTSANLPTPGGFDPQTNGGDDAFVARLDTSGSLVYATYFGGSGDEISEAIVAETVDGVWIAGYTSSTNMPVVAALDSTSNGEIDAFVARVSGDGLLTTSSYFGGSEDEHITGLASDGAGGVWATGFSFSDDLPITSFSSPGDPESIDGFVARVDAVGSLRFSSYWGGLETDVGIAAASDGSGGVWIKGFTDTPGLASLGAFGPEKSLGTDGILLRYSSSGQRVFSTYLNTRDNVGGDIAPDGFGGVWITGTTYAVDFPTLDAFDNSFAGTQFIGDAYISHVSATGEYLFGSFFGGTGQDFGKGIVADLTGGAWFVGYTGSSDLHVQNGFDSTYSGSSDAFIGYVSAAGNLTFSTYFGGGAFDAAVDVVADGREGAWIAIATGSQGLPTPGGFDSVRSGSRDAFIARVTAAELPAEILAKGVAYSDGPVNSDNPDDGDDDYEVGNDVLFPGLTGDFKVSRRFENQITGLFAYGLTSAVHGPALVYRGTEDAIDLFADSDPRGVGYGQFAAAWREVKNWLNGLDEPADLIGHSLGGALVQWTAAAGTASLAGYPGFGDIVFDQVFTFNSPGISDGSGGAPLIADVGDFDPSRVKGVTHYVASGDIVSLAGDAFIPGDAMIATWQAFDGAGDMLTLAEDWHLLPITEPEIEGRGMRPADLTLSPISVADLSSPTFGHLDNPDFAAFLASLQTAALLDPLVPPALALGVDALTTRESTESLRQGVGRLLRLLTVFRYDAQPGGPIEVRFANGSDFEAGIRLILSRDLNVSNTLGWPPYMEITGGMRIEFDNLVSVSLPGWLPSGLGGAMLEVVDLDGAASLTTSGLRFSGGASILGGALEVDGDFHVDFANLRLSLEGDASVLGNALSGEYAGSFDSGLNFASSGNVTLAFPEEAPLVGGLVVANAGSRIEFSNDGDWSNDSVAGWGQLGPIKLGLEVFFDGSVDWLGGLGFARFGRNTSYDNSFDVPTGVSHALLAAEWATPGAAALRVTRPDGVILDEADFDAQSGVALFDELNTGRRRAVLLSSPQAGTWTIEAVGIDPAGLTYEGIRMIPEAAVVVTAAGGRRRGPVTIDVTVADPLGAGTVALYHDDNGTGLDGTLIAAGLVPSAGAVRYVWNPPTGPAGTRHIYAVLDEPGLIPASDYANVPITITELRPEVIASDFEFEFRQRATLDFSQDVGASLTANSVSIVNLDTSTTLPTTSYAFSYDPLLNRVALGFEGGTLANGNYRVTIDADDVVNSSGEAMAADATLDFFVLAGDANRDGSVSILDFAILRGNFGRSDSPLFSEGDFNYDGSVSILDFAILRGNFGASVPAASPVAASLFASGEEEEVLLS